MLLFELTDYQANNTNKVNLHKASSEDSDDHQCLRPVETDCY